MDTDGIDAIHHHIERAATRLDDLAQRATSGESENVQLVAESLLVLSNTLEELRVSEEELHSQHRSLATSRELVEAERLRYQELFHFAPDAYFVTDPEGVIREANRAAAELLGVLESILPGKPMAVFVPEEHRRAFRIQLRWLFETDRLDGWEMQLKRRGGPPVPVEITVAPVRDGRGRGTGLRWLVRDIARRKEAKNRYRCGIGPWRPFPRGSSSWM